MIDSVAKSPEQNPPSVHLEVPAKNLKQLEGLKPGTAVRVVITGEVTSLTMREAEVDALGSVGNLSVEVKGMQITEQSDVFGNLLDDEDD